MKYKIIFTIFLFLFSLFYLHKATNFIRENDELMIKIKEKQNEYNVNYVDAIITKNTMIPGLSGKKINLNKSYKKMKAINSFNTSMLVFDKIKPNKTIKNKFDKLILSGNKKTNNISIILNITDEYMFNELNKILISNNVYADIIINKKYRLDNTNFKNIVSETYQDNIDFCLTYTLTINKECIKNKKYTLLGNNIYNYHLTNTKDILQNGIILVYQFNKSNYQDLNIILKYIKNNNYNIISVDKLIME